MEVSICAGVVAAVPGVVVLALVVFGGYKLWSWAWEKIQLDKLRKKLHKTYPLVVIAFITCMGYLTFSNVKFVSCNTPSVTVASVPCTCGCGRHK